MTRKQLMASALSIVLMTSAIPAPALAEALGSAQQPVAEQSADAVADAEVPETEGVPADEKDPAATTKSSDTTAEAATTDGEKDEVSAAADDEATPDEEEPAPAEDDAADATNEQQAPATVLTAAESATPAPQAAGDPYATEAPAHDASAFVGKYGTVSYYYDNGTSTGSVAIPNADAIKSIGEPVHKANGGWTVTVTLKSDLTAAQLNVPSYAVSDGANKYVDADSSKLTIEFSTSSDKASSWSCFGPARASIKFTTEKPAQPAVAFDVSKVLNVGNTVHYYANGSTKHSTSIGSMDNVVSVGEPVRHENGRMSYWSVDVTVKGTGTTAADYNVPTGYLGQTDPAEWVFDDSQDNDLVTTFVLYDGQTSWTAGTGSYALLHFKHEVAPAAPTAADVAAIQGAANYTLQNEDGSEAYSARISIPEDAIESVGEVYKAADGNYAADVTVAAKTAPADYGIEPPAFYGTAYELDEDASTLTMTLEYQDGAWTYTWPDVIQLTFAKQQPSVSFDINKVLDLDSVYVNVNGTRHQTPITNASNVVSVGQPVYHGGIRKPYWSVDVTVKVNDVTAADYGIPTGWIGNTDPATWVVDTDQPTNATVTFVLYDGQSSWRASANGALTNMYFKYEPAPFDMSEQVNKANNVAYVVYDENGNQEYSGSASLASLGGMDKVESVGDPEQQEDGTWAVDVTLADDTLASLDQTDVPAYQLKHDKGDYVLDLASSDLTGTYRTTGSGTTYTIAGTDRPTFVFRYQEPQFDMSEQVNKANNVAYVVYDENGNQEYSGSASLASLGGMDKVESVGDPEQQEDGTWAVDVTLADDTLASLDQTDVPAYQLKHDKGDYVLDLASSDLTGTYRTTGSGTTYTIAGTDRPTFVFRYQEPQEPQAPAFTYDGTVPVRYELRNADGTLITSGTTTRHDELASVSDPYLDEEGNWAVDAWMPTLTPAGLGIDGSTLGVDDLDAAFALDEDASKTAVTLRTDGQDGTVYRCVGEDGPLYVYTAKSQLDLSGEQKPTDEKPGDVQDTKTDEKDEKDEKDESADEGKALPRTSDPSSLQSVATAALSGMSALLAALGVSSRRRRNG